MKALRAALGAAVALCASMAVHTNAQQSGGLQALRGELATEVATRLAADMAEATARQGADAAILSEAMTYADSQKVTVAVEPSGANCTNGGAKITDGSGNVVYVCSAPGTPSTSVRWEQAPPGGPGWDVLVTATTKTWQMSPPHEIAVGTLNLPAGNYVVSAKLSVYGKNGGSGGFECELRNSADPSSNVDYSSIDIGVGGEKVLVLQVPIIAATDATVSFACHIYGVAGDGTSYIAADYWGANMIAQTVANVTKQ